MTLDLALATAAAEIDARLEILRQRFEHSLIANAAPAEALEDLLNWQEDAQEAWRAGTLESLRAALLDPSGWEPVEPRDPSEAP